MQEKADCRSSCCHPSVTEKKSVAALSLFGVLLFLRLLLPCPLAQVSVQAQLHTSHKRKKEDAAGKLTLLRSL